LLFAKIVEIFLQIIHNVISDDLVKEVREMATTTFDKNIVLDEAAAKKLAELLAQPAPPRPELEDEFWEENERKVKEWFARSKT